MIMRAQSPTPTPSPVPREPAKTPQGKSSTTEAKVKRWFEIDQLTASTRYHFIENENKQKPANNDNYQLIARFRFKFDPKGKYSVAANFATGPSFISEWNNSPWGTGTLQRSFALRQFYFDAKPRKEVEVQVGGLYVNYGETTETLTYDADGYIQGERVQIRSPKHLYFDEISVTYASLKDLIQPQFFRRVKHFGQQNYHQFLVRKQINKNIRFSADYTFESGRDTLHEAIRFKLPPKHLVDNILFEQYQRVDPEKDYGFNLFADRQLSKRFTLSGGFVRNKVLVLNWDRFPPGKRFYMNGLLKLCPEFSVTAQVTEGVGALRPNVARTRVDVILTYNILETLKRTRFF